MIGSLLVVTLPKARILINSQKSVMYKIGSFLRHQIHQQITSFQAFLNSSYTTNCFQTLITHRYFLNNDSSVKKTAF